MIKRDTLLKNARDLAAERASARPSVVAVYLAGSVARGDPLLGDSTDLDLIVVDDAGQSGGPLPPPEDVRLTPEIVAEIVYRRPEFYRNTAALRDHPWLGPEIAEGLALIDAAHFFERIQAGVRGRYDQPTHVHARARGFLDWAQVELNEILHCLEKPGPEPPATAQLSHFIQTLQFCAGAVVALDGKVGSARRLMPLLNETARALDRPDLSAQFAQTMSADSLTREEIESLLSIWATLYDTAAEFNRGEWGEEFYIYPARRTYYERALRALAAEGSGQNAIWLFLHTANACLSRIQHDAPPGAVYLYEEKWERALDRLRLRSAVDFAQAVGLARDYLDTVAEFVEQWGEREGA